MSENIHEFIHNTEFTIIQLGIAACSQYEVDNISICYSITTEEKTKQNKNLMIGL